VPHRRDVSLKTRIAPAFCRFRPSYYPGQWTMPARFNDFDLYTGSNMEIMVIPWVTGGSPPTTYHDLWGLAAMYLTLDPEFRVPYYDTTLDFALLLEPSIFIDCFESGDLGSWGAVAPSAGSPGTGPIRIDERDRGARQLSSSPRSSPSTICAGVACETGFSAHLRRFILAERAAGLPPQPNLDRLRRRSSRARGTRPR
jgi:hypothetical protein